MNNKHFFEMRKRHLSKTGLLVIYPISKDSVYRSKGPSKNYFDLDAVENVISFMPIFPPLSDEALGRNISATYVSADLPEPIEDYEETEADQPDTEELDNDE